MNRVSRFVGMVLVLGLAGMSLLFMAFLLDQSRHGDGGLFVAGMAGLAAMGWLLLRGPVGKAIAGILEGQGQGDELLSQQVADLEARLAEIEQRGLTSGEVEQAYARLSEMEERLEFTERLLAQPRIGGERHGA